MELKTNNMKIIIKRLFIVIGILSIISFNKPYIESTEIIRVTSAADLANVPSTTADMFLAIDLASTTASGTLIFPTSPRPGQSLIVSTRSAITSVTLNGGGIPINGSISTLAAGATVEWVYVQAANRWFRN